ncbi:MAG: hypothetical protein M0R50_03740, partial [Candidatus Cloacimonetes bacterium]|nr:hypothetical protein [Candidatus Cloacimonadota bacterium]
CSWPGISFRIVAFRCYVSLISGGTESSVGRRPFNSETKWSIQLVPSTATLQNQEEEHDRVLSLYPECNSFTASTKWIAELA